MPKYSRYPTASDEHSIDRQAKAIVDRLLAKDWLVHRLPEHDYGRDYLIEAVIDSQPSGKMFHAQLKGTKSVSFDKSGRAPRSLETRHLRYYCERVCEPVFLLLVDVTSEQGWFCFVQGELAGPLAGEQLDRQKTMTLDVRLNNVLGDVMRLRSALNGALSFMREKNPGSLQAALRSVAEQHSKLDPHFAVTGAEIKNGHTCLMLTPTGPFSFSVNVPKSSESKVVPRIDELFRYGRPLDLNTDEVDMTDLPLFADAKNKGLRGHFVFTPDNAIECEITLSANRKDQSFSFSLRGLLTRGAEGGLLLARLNDTPFGVELKIRPEDLLKNKFAEIRFTWDFSAWVGKPLSALPYIEPLTAFWQTLSDGKPVSLLITQSGNRLVKGSLSRKQMPERDQYDHATCVMLSKARTVVTALNLKTTVPNEQGLHAFDWADVDIAHELIKNGRYEKVAPNLKMNLSPVPDNHKLEALFEKQSNVGGFARIEFNAYIVRVFGEIWELGHVICEAGPITCRLADQGQSTILAEIHGQEGTVLSLTKVIERS